LEDSNTFIKIMGNMINSAAGALQKTIKEQVGLELTKKGAKEMLPPVSRGGWQRFIRADVNESLGRSVAEGGLLNWAKIPLEGDPAELGKPTEESLLDVNDPYARKDPWHAEVMPPEKDPAFQHELLELGPQKDDKFVAGLKADLYHPSFTHPPIPWKSKEKPVSMMRKSKFGDDAGDKGEDFGIRIKRSPSGMALPKDRTIGDSVMGKPDGRIDGDDVKRIFNLSMTPEEVAGYAEGVDEETVRRIRWYCQMPVLSTHKETEEFLTDSNKPEAERRDSKAPKHTTSWIGNWDVPYQARNDGKR